MTLRKCRHGKVGKCFHSGCELYPELRRLEKRLKRAKALLRRVININTGVDADYKIYSPQLYDAIRAYLGIK